MPDHRALLLLVGLAALPVHAADESAVGRKAYFPWGQHAFDVLRDVHIAAYEPDFEWQGRWEDGRQSDSGINFLHGSLSARDLYSYRHVRLNTEFLDDRIRFRFEHNYRESYNVEYNDLYIEAQLRLGGPLWLSVSGNPFFDKSESDMGGGLALMDDARENWLWVTAYADAILFDDKTPYNAQDRAPSLRIRSNTRWSDGPWRFYNDTDWGLVHRRVFRDYIGSDGVQDRRDYQRWMLSKLEYHYNDTGRIGLRHRYEGHRDDSDFFDDYADPEYYMDDYGFNRHSHRGDIYAQHRWGDWRAYAIAGYLRETDRANFKAEGDYHFVRGEILAGGRVYYGGLAEGFEIALGYWGNRFNLDRQVEAGLPSAPIVYETRVYRGYTDKADLTLGYEFKPGIKVEVVSSQEITNGTFGGSSAKIIAQF